LSTRRKSWPCAALASVLLFWPIVSAGAQERPARPVKRVVGFLSGAAAGLVVHEAGHVATGLALGAHPGFERLDYGFIPFFAVTHDTVTRRREYVISSAGFFAQHLANEWLVSETPRLRDLGECEVKHGVRLHLVNLYAEPLGNAAPPQKFQQGKATPSTAEKPARRSSAGWIAALVGVAILAAGLAYYFTSQRKAMLKVLNALVLSDDRAQLLRSAEQLNEAQYKDEFEERLDVLETLIRDAWMLSLGVQSDKLVNEDLSAELTEISRKIDPSRAADWILQIEDLREQLIVNINRKVTTDALFLVMAGDVPAQKRPKVR
jgi:flagellar motility protein MotE (MotC chaperone)